MKQDSWPITIKCVCKAGVRFFKVIYVHDVEIEKKEWCINALVKKTWKANALEYGKIGTEDKKKSYILYWMKNWCVRNLKRYVKHKEII